MGKTIWKVRTRIELEQFIVDTKEYFNWDEILSRCNIDDFNNMNDNQVSILNDFMSEMSGNLKRYEMTSNDSTEVKALGRFTNFLYDLYTGNNQN